MKNAKIINNILFITIMISASAKSMADEYNSDYISKWPQIKNTIAGDIEFKNPHEKGEVGDRLTAIRLTGMKYKKIESKYNSIHGIDGIYISDNGILKELLVVENKVDNAKLNYKTNQMSDEWVIDRAIKLTQSGSKESKAAGELIIEFFKKNPSFLKKQLWKHNLENGTTIVYELGENSETINEKYKWKDKLIKNELLRMCLSKKLSCKDIN